MDYERRRRRMVDRQLAGRRICDSRVLDAFQRVPRHLFVPEPERGQAYDDHPVAIGCGQTISQPLIAALMTQLLELRGGERVLEIGTGSGYQTAILAELAGEVCTVERFAELADCARDILDALGYGTVRYRIGDGTLGWPEFAPYDRIVVTAGAPHVPQPLVNQLAEGGVLVIPVGGSSSQTLQVVRKHAGGISTADDCRCVFVKLIGEEGWQGRE